jgi:hypothetical protein
LLDLGASRSRNVWLRWCCYEVQKLLRGSEYCFGLAAQLECHLQALHALIVQIHGRSLRISGLSGRYSSPSNALMVLSSIILSSVQLDF